MPSTLDIPVADRKLFGLFAAAVIDACRVDPDKIIENLGRVFALLMGNVQDVVTIVRVIESRPSDVATTVLAYLDPSLQEFVVDKLKKEPGLKCKIESFIGDYQRKARAEIWRRASGGEKQAIAYQEVKNKLGVAA